MINIVEGGGVYLVESIHEPQQLRKPVIDGFSPK